MPKPARRSLGAGVGQAARRGSGTRQSEKQGRGFTCTAPLSGNTNRPLPSPGCSGNGPRIVPFLLTFFSPSGKESVPDNAADHVDYLPFDTLRNMRRFDAMLPVADTVLIKYELWPRLMDVRWSSGRKVHLVAARLIQDATLLALGWMDPKRMANLTHLLGPGRPGSAETIGEVGLHSDVLGDPAWTACFPQSGILPNGALQPRLDQIGPLARRPQPARGGQRLGGRLARDPPFLRPSSGSGWCSSSRPTKCKGAMLNPGPKSPDSHGCLTSLKTDGSNGLILDEIGLLKHAYGLGAAAIVGGGWGDGVHNTLEAAAFGLPIAVGPNIAGFREIESLRSEGGLTVCSTPMRWPRQGQMDVPRRRGCPGRKPAAGRLLGCPNSPVPASGLLIGCWTYGTQPRTGKCRRASFRKPFTRLSEKRDSNSRPQPWQGCALPTELFSLADGSYTKTHGLQPSQ